MVAGIATISAFFTGYFMKDSTPPEETSNYTKATKISVAILFSAMIVLGSMWYLKKNPIKIPKKLNMNFMPTPEPPTSVVPPPTAVLPTTQ
jgi:hypothetical protein